MFEGYYKTDFMNALHMWDRFDKKAICVYMQRKYEFNTDSMWKTSFKVDGGMILDGEWYTEKTGG